MPNNQQNSFVYGRIGGGYSIGQFPSQPNLGAEQNIDSRQYSFSTYQGLSRSSSRFTISDDLFWDQVNLVSMATESLKAISGLSPNTIANWSASVNTTSYVPLYWIRYFNLNGTDYMAVMLNQTLEIWDINSGTMTTSMSGLSGVNTDIAVWLNEVLLIIDSTGYYSWNGSTFTTISTSQTGYRIVVWMGCAIIAGGAMNRVLTFTAPGTYNGFGLGSISFLLTDSSLDGQIVSMVPYGPTLLIFFPNAIYQLSDLSVTSMGLTVVSSQMLTNEVGCPFRWGATSFGSTIYFINYYGVWAMNGGVPVRISEHFNGFFDPLVQESISFGASVSIGQTLPATNYISSGTAQLSGRPFVWFFVPYQYDAQDNGWDSFMFICVSDMGDIFRINANAINFVNKNPVFAKTYYVGGNPWIALAVSDTSGNGAIYTLNSPSSGQSLPYLIQTKYYDYGNSPIYWKKLYKLGIGAQGIPSISIQAQNEATVSNTISFYTSGITYVGNTSGQVVWLSNSSNQLVYMTGTQALWSWVASDIDMWGRMIAFNFSGNTLPGTRNQITDIGSELEMSMPWGTP